MVGVHPIIAEFSIRKQEVERGRVTLLAPGGGL